MFHVHANIKRKTLNLNCCSYCTLVLVLSMTLAACDVRGMLLSVFRTTASAKPGPAAVPVAHKRIVTDSASARRSGSRINSATGGGMSGRLRYCPRMRLTCQAAIVLECGFVFTAQRTDCRRKYKIYFYRYTLRSHGLFFFPTMYHVPFFCLCVSVFGIFLIQFRC